MLLPKHYQTTHVVHQNFSEVCLRYTQNSHFQYEIQTMAYPTSVYGHPDDR